MHNEAEALPTFRAQLDDALAVLADRLRIGPDEIEVVVVDDGSTDDTGAGVMAIAPGRPIRLVRHEQRRGLGAALWTGFGAASGATIVTVDADCTYPLVEIVDLLALLDPDTSIVTASPYHPAGGVEGVPPLRLFLSRTLSRLYNVVLRTHLHTYTAMFRAYRRAALADVPRRSDGFVAVTEMLVFPLLAGHRVREHPTVLHRRQTGVSKIRVARVIREHLRFLAWLAVRRSLGRLRRAASVPDRSN